MQEVSLEFYKKKLGWLVKINFARKKKKPNETSDIKPAIFLWSLF